MKNLSLSSFTLVLLAVLLNMYKEELFLAKYGYAPSEIKFAFLVILPILITSFSFSIFVYIKWFKMRNSNESVSWVCLFFAAPGLVMGLLYLMLALFLIS